MSLPTTPSNWPSTQSWRRAAYRFTPTKWKCLDHSAREEPRTKIQISRLVLAIRFLEFSCLHWSIIMTIEHCENLIIGSGVAGKILAWTLAGQARKPLSSNDRHRAWRSHE